MHSLSEISESSSDSDNWSTVDRERRCSDRKKRSKERKARMQAALSSKARRMAGISPITDRDIETQRRKT